jgi:N-acetylglucosaminyl-diphospho-decaprenol L-rhamnosyltransferase
MEKTITIRAVEISISIVSHGQINLIENLLHDIAEHCQMLSVEIILTLNLEEELPFSVSIFPFPISIISNSLPQGFGVNQNQAFRQASGQFFCVLNPDIRLNDDPFPALLDCLRDPSVGVVSPAVLNEFGELEDCARRFPTPLKILCKAFGGCKGSDYVVTDQPIFPDWVGGMFMVFPCEIFTQLSGFDERFFLYYEDVDLCARLRLQGYEVVMYANARVIHHAHRSSHQNFEYMRWHIMSMTRFFCSSVFLKTLCLKLKKRCIQIISYTSHQKSI